ncbi:type II secretion system F family protein [Candidatus Magnetaquicoccus inordinatus]|uniref:type II secretion system F family protein n=1 Tax=Candidatus Magnetaquicoccus inordinatus TaxID=2496818 RepID=UPI00102CE018|nr:type II secretion system F family protein [Candidatus Magnetaquicoccus inordinatus]
MRGITNSDVLIFTNQFSAMMRSHLLLVDVLQNLSRESTNKKMGNLLAIIAKRVEAGEDLGEVLSHWPKIFGPIYIGVVKAGMESGRLDLCLQQISVYLDRMDNLRQRVRQAITYPILLLVATIVVFLIMTLHIFPRFEHIFKQLKAKLPDLTLAMMGISHWLQENGFVLMIYVIAMILLTITIINTRRGRLFWDRYLLKVPIIGRLVRLAALARFARTFAVQVQNDVPVLNAIDLAATASGNKYVEQQLFLVHQQLEGGYSLGEAFGQHAVFAGVTQQMISSGEQMGNLDELLFLAAEYFERMLDYAILRVTTLINPTLTALMGIIVAVLMLSAFLPILEMTSSVTAKG